MVQVLDAPRYKEANNKADKFLLDDGMEALPFKPLKCLKEMAIKVESYQSLAERKGCTVKDICEIFKSKDATTLYLAKSKRFIVLYNNAPSQKRINWTLAHELGHIILGHFELLEEKGITTDDLSEELALLLDKEADAFAGEVLAPSFILFTKRCITPAAIMAACNISLTAASIKSSYLSKLDRYYFSKTEHKLIKVFEEAEKYMA